jgi:hypothetical protein
VGDNVSSCKFEFQVACSSSEFSGLKFETYNLKELETRNLQTRNFLRYRFEAFDELLKSLV